MNLVFNSWDSDALAYIANVETADGQALEFGVKKAINNFVSGCKEDGTWAAFSGYQAGLFAGPRTLDGAKVPLCGPALTWYSVTDAMRNRYTGIRAGVSGAYATGIVFSDLPANNAHQFVYCTTPKDSGVTWFGTSNSPTGGATFYTNTTTHLRTYFQNLVSADYETPVQTTGGAGQSRNASDHFNYMISGALYSASEAYHSRSSERLALWATPVGNYHGSPRIAFYSAGSFADLVKLNLRAERYIAELAMALSTNPGGFDPDAWDYIGRVEAVDAQALEDGVRQAIDKFVRGLKTDRTWHAIHACGLIPAARTLNGCLVPLKGPSVTNFGFVSGDYSRAGGVQGNSTKYMTISRNDSTQGIRDEMHAAVWISSANTGGVSLCAGSGAAGTGATALFNSGTLRCRANTSDSSSGANSGTLHGVSRGASGNYQARVNGATSTITRNSDGIYNSNWGLFWSPVGSANYGNSKLGFYSIGTPVDLALLEARVSTLMVDLAIVLA